MSGPQKLLTITALAVLVSCGRGAEDYPPEIAEPFLNSCAAGGTSSETCQCALDKMEEKYSAEEFSQESLKFSQGTGSEEFKQDITSFSVECAAEAQ